MNEKTHTPVRWFGIPRLVPYMRPYGRLIRIMVLMGLYGSAMDAVIPLFQQYAIDHFIADSVLDGLWVFIGLYVLVIATQVASNYISAFGACKIELWVGRDLKRESFNHLQTLSFSYFNQNSVGYIHARVMSDTDRIASTLAWAMMEGVWHSAYLICAVVMMLVINWKLALCVLVVVPVVALTSMYFQKKLVFFHRQVREKNSRITSAFNEGITGAPTTKTLGIEDKMEREFRELTGDMRAVSVRTMHFRAMFMSTTALAASVALALVLWRGGIVTREGLVLIGTLTVFMNYAQGMMEPIQWLVQALSNMVNVQVNVERFTHLMETESDVRDTPEVIEKYGDTLSPKKENWEPLYGDVEFEDVTFRYPDGDEDILEHFDLKIPRGTNVAIVGETEAGKSTLVNLVCRFFEPTAGRVLIDGRDARERSQLWLHSNIGYVLQTPHLFSGTVLENLRYGRPDATMAEIEEAVKAVSADGIIDRLPQGYDSDVGEGGNSLSTGEKQLLSFARALLADPRIFVLDEATSSVDTVTERLIQEAIEKVMAGRTSFVIAHRLSTIRRADLILVVKDGKIVEQGSHAQLMAARGVYHGLYTRQYREEKLRSSVE
ncbi:MAG: ABC transporter ATP-binding protein [Oscillospiraceae bacterium]|nr:ABC transporter ATP-binding protein [Oscillospiraceae bacterium]